MTLLRLQYWDSATPATGILLTDFGVVSNYWYSDSPYTEVLLLELVEFRYSSVRDSAIPATGIPLI